MQRGASFKSKGDWQSKSNRFLLGMALFLCIMLISCDNKSKENAVFDLLVLRTELENNDSNYSEKDWENAFDKYDEICQRLDEMQFTYEEQMEIDKVKGEIAGTVTSYAVQDFSDELQVLSDEFFSFAEGFMDSFQKQIIQE